MKRKQIAQFITESCFLAVGLIGLLTAAGCATRADMQSVKATTYQRMPQRLFIVADLGMGFPSGEAVKLGDLMTRSLTSCGISSSFNQVGGLTIEDPIQMKLKQYSPDTLLTMKWTQAQSSQGGLNSIVYHFELGDFMTKKVVWKANMNMYPTHEILMQLTVGNQAAEVFAKTLFDRMKADAVLPRSCAVIGVQ